MKRSATRKIECVLLPKYFTLVKEDIKDYIQHNRRQFRNAPFSESDAAANPFDQFDHWFENAVDAGILDPYAMSLATVDADGVPAVRVVYMRNITRDGLVFFTNYKSHKALDIQANPAACVNFYWEELSRQVRITGRAKYATTEVSDAYFASRPRMSQIGAWASHQSHPLRNRQELMDRIERLTRDFEGKEVPRPDFWGGIVIEPYHFEFWQGRESRLHDRLAYRQDSRGNWNLSRLSP